jgi:hypothetical protein
MNADACSMCGCSEGSFNIENDELTLDFKCNHETVVLIMNTKYLGEAIN